jgi:hypothetical protein
MERWRLASPVRTVDSWYCGRNFLLLRLRPIAPNHGVTSRERALETASVIAAIAFVATLLVNLNFLGS